ncbi:YfhO family protein [Armatimonas sp.]|uniref:YfhO family protein n=1 Tax=Armatimonas sp. TaxID=1872638 RepID=UPI003751160F
MKPALPPALLVGLVLFFYGSLIAFDERQVRLGEDIALFYYPWRVFAQESLNAGVWPLWKPYSFAGIPFLASLEAGLFYPAFWLAIFLPVGCGLVWDQLLHLCLGALGMYFLLLHYTRSVPAALFSGLAFPLGTFFATRVAFGHVPVIEAAVGLPWFLLLTEKVLAEPKGWRWPVLLGSAYGMNLLVGFPEISFMAGAVFTLRWLTALRTQPVALALALRYGVVVLVSLGVSAVQLAPALTVLERSARTALPMRFVREQSLPPLALPTLAVPALLGSAATHNALLKGPSVEMPGYVGVLTLHFALAALILARRRRTGFFVGLLLGGLLLAMGPYNPLYSLLARLPGLSFIARPVRWMFLVAFTLPVLGGLGLAAILESTTSATRRRLQQVRLLSVAVVALGLGALLATLGGRSKLTALGQARILASYPENPERQLTKLAGLLTGQRQGIGLFVVFSAVALGFLWGRRRHPALAYLPSVVLYLDLGLANAPSLGLPKALLAPPVDTFQSDLPEDARAFRFLPLEDSKIWPESGALTKQYSAVGYDSLTSKELFAYLAAALGKPAADLDPLSPTTTAADWPQTRNGLLDRLGVRYVASKEELPLPRVAPGLYLRDSALPLARVVHTVLVEQNKEYALERLKTLAPAAALIEQKVLVSPTTAPEICKTQRPTPSSIRTETTLTAPGLLVVHEAYYDGWEARIDGKPSPVLRADYLFMGVPLEAGRHTIELTYQAPYSAMGRRITALTTGGLVIFFVLGLTKRRKIR